MMTGLEQENQALRTELAMLEGQVRQLSAMCEKLEKARSELRRELDYLLEESTP